MKKTDLFCTEWWMYLSELGPLCLLLLCIHFNGKLDTPEKLYPLIAFCVLCMTFIFVFLFRLISISKEEIRSIGPFTSMTTAKIEEGRSLTFVLKKGKRTAVLLEGKSDLPGFSWMRGGEYDSCEINLYRERATCKIGGIKRVLKHFGVSEYDCVSVFKSDSYFKEYDSYTLSSEMKDGERRIKLSFIKTT